MNLDKSIKMMLLKINMSGREVNLIREQKYSKEFKTITAYYRLVFWHTFVKKNKRTGELKECRVPDIHIFKNQAELALYMVGVMNE